MLRFISCLNLGTASYFTLLDKQTALTIFLISRLNEKDKSVRCPTAAVLQTQIRADHMKSCRLYSRPGRENYSPALSTLALNLN